MDIKFGLFLLVTFSIVSTGITFAGVRNGFSKATITGMAFLAMASCLGVGVFQFPPSNLYIGAIITFITFEIALFVSKRLRLRAFSILDESNA